MPLDKIAEQGFLEGFDLFERARYSDAYTIYASLVRRYPTEGKVYFWLGWTLHHLGDKEKAQEAMESSAHFASVLPQNPYIVIANWAGVDLADIRRQPWLNKAKDWAIKSDQPVLIAEAQCEQALFDRDKTRARQYLEEAISYTPDDAQLLAMLSTMLIDLEQYEAARELLLEAKERRVTSFNLLYDLGRATMKLNREAEAMAIYEDAIYGKGVVSVKRTNQFRWAAHLLSRYYLRKGRFRDLSKLSFRQLDLEDELTAQKKAYRARLST
ncbi:MAG: tetratricopeptide repeat protein [Armatimonadota bacterium]